MNLKHHSKNYFFFVSYFSAQSGCGRPPKQPCDNGTLHCGQNMYVRCERTGCDNNTCSTALLSGPRACAQYIQLITWCDCWPCYYRNSIGKCVTKQQCQREANCKLSAQ